MEAKPAHRNANHHSRSRKDVVAVILRQGDNRGVVCLFADTSGVDAQNGF